MSTPAPAPAPATPIEQKSVTVLDWSDRHTHLGCYKDVQEDRVFSRLPLGGNMTPEVRIVMQHEVSKLVVAHPRTQITLRFDVMH